MVILDALLHTRPSITAEPIRIQQGIAYLYWVSASKGRRHNQHPDHFSVNHIELAARFGRGGFERLNTEHNLFVVRGKHRPGSTKAYRWTDDFNDAMRRYIHHFNRDLDATTSLVQPDGTAVQHRRHGAGSHDQLPRPTTLCDDVSVLDFAPVDLYALHRLEAVLEQASRSKPSEGASLLKSLDLDECIDLQSLMDVLSRMLVSARIDTVGCGRIHQAYRQCSTGRFFAQGTNLQSAPNIIKRVALNGLWQYDFSNCHLTILHQLAERIGISSPELRYYLDNKEEVREGVASRVGITKKQAKVCLLKLTYGAKASSRSVDGIPSEIGVKRALAFYRDPFVAKLKAELIAARDTVLENWPQEAGFIYNALRLPCSVKARPGERLAHLLQGIEAQALMTATSMLIGHVVLLEHDGFVTSHPIDADAVALAVEAATGLHMPLIGEQLLLPPVLLGFPQKSSAISASCVL